MDVVYMHGCDVYHSIYLFFYLVGLTQTSCNTVRVIGLVGTLSHHPSINHNTHSFFSLVIFIYLSQKYIRDGNPSIYLRFSFSFYFKNKKGS